MESTSKDTKKATKSAAVKLPKAKGSSKAKTAETQIVEVDENVDPQNEQGTSKNSGLAVEQMVSPEALLVDLVTENIVNRLELKDLKTCRVVCQTWNKHATLEIEKRNYIVNFSNSHKLAQYTKTMKKNPMILFTKFCLKNKFSPRIQTHIVKHGPNIKTLYIETESNRKNAINFQNVIVILSSTRNLEHLRLKKVDFPCDPDNSLFDDPEPIPDLELSQLKTIHIDSNFWNLRNRYHYPPILNDEERRVRRLEWIKKLFQSSPNLTTLELNIPIRNGTVEFEMFSSCLKGLVNLKHFGMDCQMEQSHLQALLAGATMKLETLRINQSAGQIEVSRCFIIALMNFEESLKSLDLSITWYLSNIIEAYAPKLKNLRQMTLRFDPERDHYCKLNFMENIQLRLPKLMRLDLYHANCSILQNTFEYFYLIEELRIHSFSTALCSNINTILTGLPDAAETLKSIRRLQSRGLSEAQIQTFLKWTLLAADHSLRDMSNLKILELGSGDKNACVTYLTAFFVLLQMQPLELLKLNNVQFSDGMKECLVEHNQTVTFS